MDDQAQAVESADPLDNLVNALGEPEQHEDEEEQQTGSDTTDEQTEEPEQDEAKGDQPQTFRVKVRGEDGSEKDEDLSLEELAAGYMRTADYTRKQQQAAQRVEQEAAERVSKVHEAAVDQLNRLQALALEQAAPELMRVDWQRLAQEDPAQYVALQAKQQQLNATLQALEQRKQAHQAELTKTEQARLDQALKQSEEVLSKSVKGFTDSTVTDLIGVVDKDYGIRREHLRDVAQAIAKSGLPADTLGKLLLGLHEGAQWRKLQAAKPQAMKKVAEAPRVIKPAAPQPHKTNQAASDRLKRSGRVEDLAAFL
jgi:hypothetical protein